MFASSTFVVLVIIGIFPAALGIDPSLSVKRPIVRPENPFLSSSVQTSPFRSEGPLTQYFNNVTKGPGFLKWLHYFDIYEKHLARFRHTDVHVVEIGVFAGGSLRMWRNYFGSRARIMGIDYQNMSRRFEHHPNYGRPDRIFIGDQEDPNFWKRFRRLVPRVDVIIDDGGHQPNQQEVTLKMILAHISAGGVYICEDVHGDNPFAGYVFKMINGANGGLNDLPNYEPETNWVQRNVAEVSFYPYVIVIEKTPWKRPKLNHGDRGTQWIKMILTNGRVVDIRGKK